MNFAGKFSDDSTQDDWFFRPDRVKLSIAEHVDPVTKEFAFRWDKEVTSTFDWFCDVPKLQRIDRLPDLSKVTTAKAMFTRCYALEEINVPELNLVNARDISLMFYDCKSLRRMNSRIVTSDKVTSLERLFATCMELEYVDLSGIDTSSVTVIYDMFCDCQSLSSIDLSTWKFNKKLTSSQGAFARCLKLKYIDMPGFNADTLASAYPRLLFTECNEINHIRTTQGFKDFAIANKDVLKLPSAMLDGGTGVWEIVD